MSGQHHPAYKADTGSLIGNIMEAAKEIERLAKLDPMDFLGSKSGISSDFFKP